MYPEAIKYYISCPYSENGANPGIECAIETVKLANEDALTHQLIDYLMGIEDHIVKDSMHIFNLHMALQNFTDATNTAIVIASEEQLSGNYEGAHKVLLKNYLALKTAGLKIPLDLYSMLMMLHSYLQVKVS